MGALQNAGSGGYTLVGGTVSSHEIVTSITQTGGVPQFGTGIVNTVEATGSILDSYFAGTATRSAGGLVFSGLADTVASGGTVRRSYSYLMPDSNITTNHLCIRSNSGTATGNYAIHDLTNPILGLQQTRPATSSVGCTILDANQALLSGSYGGFDFSTIWALPGFFTVTPGIQP